MHEEGFFSYVNYNNVYGRTFPRVTGDEWRVAGDGWRVAGRRVDGWRVAGSG